MKRLCQTVRASLENNKKGKIIRILLVEIYIFYFSMMHCPPCREFTPLLSQLYNAQITKHWEVIFFSCDLKQENFDAYLQKMPWFAMPFRDKRLRSVALEFGVKEVP